MLNASFKLNLLSLLAIILAACNSENKGISEGKLHYKIDYPQLKSQFFIYQILPKDLCVSFKNNQLKAHIEKAGIENTMYINNDSKTINCFFKGDKSYYSEIKNLRNPLWSSENHAYQIELSDQRDTLAGLNICLAIATDTITNRKIQIWYTTDLEIKDPNWYSSYKDVPGVLVKYSMTRFDVEMEVSLVKFEAAKIKKSEVKFSKKGTKVAYSEFHSLLSNLFKSFQ